MISLILFKSVATTYRPSRCVTRPRAAEALAEAQASAKAGPKRLKIT